METDRNRGRGLRRNRSRELLSKLLPGRRPGAPVEKKARPTDPHPAPLRSNPFDAPATARGRSRSAGKRLSAFLHSASNLNLAGIFSVSETENSVSPTAEQPIVVAGPSGDSNIRRVEAQHPAQWPGVDPDTRRQTPLIDSELVREVRNRRSIIERAEGSGMTPSDISAAIAGMASPSAMRKQSDSAKRSSVLIDAGPRSIAQVLAISEPVAVAPEALPVSPQPVPGSSRPLTGGTQLPPIGTEPLAANFDEVSELNCKHVVVEALRSEQPCNLAFTLQTELSILQRKLAVRETQCVDLTARIAGLESTSRAAHSSATEKSVENVALREEIRELKRKLEDLEVKARTARDSKMEMHGQDVTERVNGTKRVVEMAQDTSAVDVAWTFVHREGESVEADETHAVEQLAPEVRAMSARTSAPSVDAVETGSREPGHDAKAAAKGADVQAPAVVPDSNADADMEMWKQEELEMAIMGLVFAANAGHPAHRT